MIDRHTHLESSKLSVTMFAKTVVSKGRALEFLMLPIAGIVPD